MTPYADPQGRFRIEYPTGWQVRPQAAAGSTAFYLDDPDEGIAVTVQTQGTVSGRVEGGALTPVVLRQLKQRYPDLTLVVTSSQLLAGGARQSEFTAQWTNRWAQRMRATGRIVSVIRDGNTAYAYVAGQAQELLFPGVEPILLRMLDSFSEIPKG
jgi:hypothetical protein